MTVQNPLGLQARWLSASVSVARKMRGEGTLVRVLLGDVQAWKPCPPPELSSIGSKSHYTAGVGRGVCTVSLPSSLLLHTQRSFNCTFHQYADLPQEWAGSRTHVNEKGNDNHEHKH